jgi:hypothetical protein
VEALLAGRVPQLHPEGARVHADRFRYEVDAYCGLRANFRYLLVPGEVVEDEPVYDRGFPHGLVA